jgi:hypothetical protein
MILGNVLGFTVGQITAIRDEGYTDLEDFTDVPPEHLRKMCMNLSKLTNARGGVRLRFKLVVVERHDELLGNDSTR